MGYNKYRRRSYSISKSKARSYAEDMENLQDSFLGLQKDGWTISNHLDSCYKLYDNFEIRISNHSANNQYHDLNGENLIVNIKKSKLEFVSFIENNLTHILEKLGELDLTKYRFINIVNSRITCYLKDFKTKKDIIEIG